METVDLSKRLVTWRKARKLTQAQLAKKAKLSQPTIAHLETERMDPSMATLARVLDALDVSFEKFFGRLPKVR